MADKPSIKSVKTDIALLVLRVVFGFFMIARHGWPKFQKLFSGEEIQFINFLGLGEQFSLALAVFAELLCSLLVILGLMTRLATIPLIITMLVAVFIVNFGNPLSDLELGFLYLGAFLALFYMGSGKYSLDYWISKV
ncbi:MAG TPA: DoxX family protein [Saprospiraceae bacterium]|nr:DoxX family protein [Saprospiraceae bacterium]